MSSSRRGALYASAIFLLAAPAALWLVLSHVGLRTGGAPSGSAALAAIPPPPATPVTMAVPEIATAALDPTELVRAGRERYEQQVRDYRCVLLKQEWIDGALTPLQTVEVRYRSTPRSVYMIWQQNADQVKRALFVDDGRNIDSDGNKLARVEPAGAIVRLFVADVMIPIRGERARRASRRTIDECGFLATFDILDRVNAAATQRNELDFRYEGASQIDGRETHVLVRYLPYQGEGGVYPDAKMVMHLDREWLLPVAIYSYSDHEGRNLLGSYLFTQVSLNAGLGDDAFQF
ncbi:hypothetical protein RAS1_09520 [Phycisphaerae bacterium RAS1]|nr:hypothetical protein RAS1_09520 [Phycisphaerae bacterium RAS1]